MLPREKSRSLFLYRFLPVSFALSIADTTSLNYTRQFYSLSKIHHPDHNPTDPQASERFVKISAAYSVLGSPENRSRYDRDTFQTSSSSSSSGPSYSYSYSSASTSSPFGARPASGLSRRRTQFKGPPPSFYRSGGWGSHAARRGAQAEATAHAARDSAERQNQESQSQHQSANGMGPGQGHAWFGGDVPHFDQEGHLRTQQQWDKRRWRRRRKDTDGRYDDDGSGSFATGVVVCASIIVGSAAGTAAYYIEEAPSTSHWERDRRKGRQY